MRALLLLACLCSMSLAVAAEKDKVYKWVDKQGVVHYSNKPPEEGAQPAQLPPLQTYKGGTPPADLSKYSTSASAPDKAALPAAGAGKVTILSPAPEETIREADQAIAVAVEVPGGLSGRRLVYYLDGKASGGPTNNTTMSVSNVERGSHTLAVALVDGDGKEVGRSSSVTFYMKPPTARR